MIEFICSVGKRWDKLSQTKETAIQFAHSNINPEPKRFLDEAHQKYSKEYELAHYGDYINWRFRKNSPDKGDLEMVDMVENHTTKTDLVLYRGVDDDVFELMQKNAKNMVGVDLYERGFLSCTLVKGQEYDDKCKLRIFVPKGSHAVYLGNVNNELNNYEVVIQQGTALRIRSIDQTYINCEIV